MGGGWAPRAGTKHHHLRLGGVHTQPVLLAESVQGVDQGLDGAGILRQEDHVVGKQQALKEGAALGEADASLGDFLGQPSLNTVQENVEKQRGEWVVLAHATGDSKGGA